MSLQQTAPEQQQQQPLPEMKMEVKMEEEESEQAEVQMEEKPEVCGMYTVVVIFYFTSLHLDLALPPRSSGWHAWCFPLLYSVCLVESDQRSLRRYHD